MMIYPLSVQQQRMTTGMCRWRCCQRCTLYDPYRWKGRRNQRGPHPQVTACYLINSHVTFLASCHWRHHSGDTYACVDLRRPDKHFWCVCVSCISRCLVMLLSVALLSIGYLFIYYSIKEFYPFTALEVFTIIFLYAFLVESCWRLSLHLQSSHWHNSNTLFGCQLSLAQRCMSRANLSRKTLWIRLMSHLCFPKSNFIGNKIYKTKACTLLNRFYENTYILFLSPWQEFFLLLILTILYA